MNLSNLIERCGNKIMSIRKVWGEDGNITNWIVEGDTKPVIVSIGKTPEEAVDKFLKEIQKYG